MVREFGNLVVNPLFFGVLVFAVCVMGFQVLANKWREVIQRRKAVGMLAGKLQAWGLKRVPEILLDYSHGGYAECIHEVAAIVKLFLHDDKALFAELESVYKRVLAEHVKSDDGRAFIAQVLAEATKAAARPAFPSGI